jgi:hypothetical protein
MLGFGISSVEPLGYATAVLVTSSLCLLYFSPHVSTGSLQTDMTTVLKSR